MPQDSLYGVAEYMRDWPRAFENVEHQEGAAMRLMCNHGVSFDEDEAKHCGAREVRELWPRFFGTCEECGFRGIYYDSYAHYIYGDW